MSPSCPRPLSPLVALTVSSSPATPHVHDAHDRIAATARLPAVLHVEKRDTRLRQWPVGCIVHLYYIHSLDSLSTTHLRNLKACSNTAPALAAALLLLACSHSIVAQLDAWSTAATRRTRRGPRWARTTWTARPHLFAVARTVSAKTVSSTAAWMRQERRTTTESGRDADGTETTRPMPHPTHDETQNVTSMVAA